MNGETADHLAARPLLPALGLASAVILILSVVILLLRHRGSKPGGARKASTVLNGEHAAAQDDRPKALILFGTQTGTAERFSKQLKAELATRYGEGNKYEVQDLEEIKGEALATEKVVFFMMATYGDGEPTDNAADFYGWLVKAAAEADKGVGNKQLLEVGLPPPPAAVVGPCMLVSGGEHSRGWLRTVAHKWPSVFLCSQGSGAVLVLSLWEGLSAAYLPG